MGTNSDRRSLSAAVKAAGTVDATALREFVTQEPRQHGTAVVTSRSLVPGDGQATTAMVTRSATSRRARSTGVTPVGLIPVTVRLRPELAGALKRASLERQLAGESLFTQQDIITELLEPWLRAEGFITS